MNETAIQPKANDSDLRSGDFIKQYILCVWLKAHNQTQQNPSSNVNADEVARLQAQIHELEDKVDTLLQSLSLPGSPRPIVP
ncbi:hypothetical protein [Polynucleobacter necessarius]|uniref:hypothetical protein n=1 Tax=Polynucleobacter necessarius TaxID=576610 RepID=UPI000E08F54C|nr:hypothetical protein [Polynucleobacter necessarius]